jgi:hypothetical protein
MALSRSEMRIPAYPDRTLVTAIMSNQTSDGFAYIERQYKDVKGRIELQRRVVAQLHLIEADASEAEASLNALLDDEASKLQGRCGRCDADRADGLAA